MHRLNQAQSVAAEKRGILVGGIEDGSPDPLCVHQPQRVVDLPRVASIAEEAAAVVRVKIQEHKEWR